MKVQLKKTVIEEVEVTFPIFKKTSCHQVMIVSETELYVITERDKGIAFEENVCTLEYWLKAEDSTRIEFLNAAKQINGFINLLIQGI